MPYCKAAGQRDRPTSPPKPAAWPPRAAVWASTKPAANEISFGFARVLAISRDTIVSPSSQRTRRLSPGTLLSSITHVPTVVGAFSTAAYGTSVVKSR